MKTRVAVLQGGRSGEHEISLAFLTPFENKVGRVVTLISVLAIATLFWFGLRRERRA
jgi:D-alanine-D-alanine ligase-like ATP-grasp enzyme